MIRRGRCFSRFFCSLFACWFAGRFALFHGRITIRAGGVGHRVWCWITAGLGWFGLAGLIAVIFAAIISGNTPPTTAATCRFLWLCIIITASRCGIICIVASRAICRRIIIIAGGFDLLIILAITLTTTPTPAAAATTAPFWLVFIPGRIITKLGVAIRFISLTIIVRTVIGLVGLLRLKAILTAILTRL